MRKKVLSATMALFLLVDVVIILGLIPIYMVHAIPEFTGFGKLKVEKVTQTEITISAEATLYNPNAASCTLVGTDLIVVANGKDVGTIKQKLSVEIPGKSSFALPIRISFSPAKIFKADNLLGNIISSLVTREIELQYTGALLVNMAGIKIPLDIDYSESIPIDIKL